ncbi:MAG: hypothetical protein ACFCUV_03505 [Rivularia sp. (in: cyanobacteria)]
MPLRTVSRTPLATTAVFPRNAVAWLDKQSPMTKPVQTGLVCVVAV